MNNILNIVLVLMLIFILSCVPSGHSEFIAIKHIKKDKLQLIFSLINDNKIEDNIIRRNNGVQYGFSKYTGQCYAGNVTNLDKATNLELCHIIENEIIIIGIYQQNSSDNNKLSDINDKFMKELTSKLNIIISNSDLHNLKSFSSLDVFLKELGEDNKKAGVRY